MRGWRRWLLALAGLLVLVGVGYGAPVASILRSQLARAVLWASPMGTTAPRRIAAADPVPVPPAGRQGQRDDHHGCQP